MPCHQLHLAVTGQFLLLLLEVDQFPLQEVLLSLSEAAWCLLES